MIAGKGYYAMGGFFLVATACGAWSSYLNTKHLEYLHNFPSVVEYITINSYLDTKDELIDNLRGNPTVIDDLLEEKSQLTKRRETLLQYPSVKEYTFNHNLGMLSVASTGGSFVGFLFTGGVIARRRKNHQRKSDKEVNDTNET